MMAGRLRYLRRTHQERVLFLRAAFSLVVCRISLKLVSFTTTRRLVRSLSRPTQTPVRADGAPLVSIQWAAAAAGRRMPWAVTCLTMAICTQALCEHLGEQVSMKIGVAKDGDEFRAHAWVESQGRVICGELSDLPEFTVLTSLAGDAE